MDSRWKSIRTAPKNVRILVCAESHKKEIYYEIFLAEFMEQDGFWYVPGAHVEEGWVDLFFTPILWMPAPSMPFGERRWLGQFR